MSDAYTDKVTQDRLAALEARMKAVEDATSALSGRRNPLKELEKLQSDVDMLLKRVAKVDQDVHITLERDRLELTRRQIKQILRETDGTTPKTKKK